MTGRNVILGIVALVVLAGAYVALGGTLPGATGATPTPGLSYGDVENLVVASGTLLPVQRSNLSFRMAGMAKSVTAKAGDVVKEGDVLARLDTAELDAAVAQAKAGVATAQAALAELRAGPGREDIAVAQAAVDSAKAQLAKVQAGPTAEDLAIAKANLIRAEADLSQAQFAYDGVRGMDIVSMLPESRALHLATQEYAVAKANHDLVARGARAEDIRIAEAAVSAAQASLDRAKAAARPEAVSAAQARVDQAQAAVLQAQAALAGATLAAPFGGTVAEVNLNPGEAVAPGQVVIILGDVSSLRLETNDLSETNVARVKVGQAVAVTFEALPGKQFKGSVTRIAPISSQRQGGTNYTVIVQVEGLDPALRWGMTGNIEIDTAK